MNGGPMGFGGNFGNMPMNGGPMGGQMMPMPNEGFNGGMGNNGFDNGPYAPYNGKRK
jgi:hypothetical protein